MIKEITSLQHPLVKHLVKLRENKKYRTACARLCLSGAKLIRELPDHFPLHTLFLEIGAKPPRTARQTFFVTPEILKKVTGLENPEPIAAEIDISLPKDLSNAHFLLILDGISDPGNLGTLMRSARALGWEGVFLTERSADPFNEKAIRAAKGATFTLPWAIGTAEEVLELIMKKKMTLLAADVSGRDFTECRVSSPIALALGNEAHGLSSFLKELSLPVAIPMMERIESLNVAAAGAILMHHFKKDL